MPQIPRKPTRAPAPETNGQDKPNGKHALEADTEVEPKGVKRTHTEDGGQPLKKAKISDSVDDVVVVEDAVGAILIDD